MNTNTTPTTPDHGHDWCDACKAMVVLVEKWGRMRCSRCGEPINVPTPAQMAARITEIQERGFVGRDQIGTSEAFYEPWSESTRRRRMAMQPEPVEIQTVKL